MNNRTRAKSAMVLLMVLPVLLILLAQSRMDHLNSSLAFKTFGNAVLTSYSLSSVLLLVALIAYGDSRKRPITPLLGMAVAAIVGTIVTYALTSMDDLLLVDNGSARAQILSNVLNFSTVGLGFILSLAFVGGLVFASLMNRNIKRFEYEEE